MAANGWGCEVGATQPTKYVKGITTERERAVTATVQGISGSVDGKVVTLIPLSTRRAGGHLHRRLSKTLFGWLCGGTGTNVNLKYLPGSCRGSNKRSASGKGTLRGTFFFGGR